MTRTYTLTDQGMEAIRASDAFTVLHREQADMLEEILYDFFWGQNVIPRATVQLLLDRLIENVRPDDPDGLRRVILKALSVQESVNISTK
jgi:hypothetical protein